MVAYESQLKPTLKITEAKKYLENLLEYSIKYKNIHSISYPSGRVGNLEI